MITPTSFQHRYSACALVDMAMHMQSNFDDFDLKKFEDAELARLGMPQGIVMRHRPTHFQHLFSGSHYAAGYYVYVLMLGYVMAISLCHGALESQCRSSSIVSYNIQYHWHNSSVLISTITTT